MSDITKEDILAHLSNIRNEDENEDIVSLGMVESVLINDGKVIFSIKVPADQAQAYEPLRAMAEKLIGALDGVEKATAVLTAEREASAKRMPPQGGPMPAGKQAQDMSVPGIKHIIAVASGKGGVGKSTTSVNLALGLADKGLSVGILDADIYGPSMPRMLGVNKKPESEGKRMNPLSAYGIKVMSMGFLIEEETPMIWRGPMVIQALTQLLREVAWGELDILVVDMPPGTGDAQLTMAQQVPLAGAVIVSTPQDIALIDARKGLNMFRKVNVPILGLIENMSTFICPKCGERSDIFGNGGARAEADKLGVPFLGEVPLHMDIRTNSDNGTPVVVSQPDGPHSSVYKSIAEKVIEALQLETLEAPEIVFE